MKGPRAFKPLTNDVAADDLPVAMNQRSVGLAGKGRLRNPPDDQRIETAQEDGQSNDGQEGNPQFRYQGLHDRNAP